MIKIMFVCYGNICRSPMAEFLFNEEVKKRGLENKYFAESSATSFEEIGNGVHRGTREILSGLGIDCSKKRSKRLQAEDYSNFDWFLVMDKANYRDSLDILGDDVENKVHLLLEFTDNVRDVADPWYTRNFKVTYDDLKKGINAFIDYLEKHS